MGIDGLYKFINKNIPEVYNNIGINEIRGRSCIIDGMQHIYSQLIYMRSRGKEVITSNGSNISHIYGLINSLTYYLKFGIIPIFVFDGKAPDIKRSKIEERRKNLKENLKKLKDLEKEKNYLIEILNSKSALSDNKINNEDTEDSDLEIIEPIIDPENILNQDNDDNDKYIFGTHPETFNLEEEIKKINNIQEEYKKIYKKSILLKDYFILDWILILEYLGLPVVKAKGEADPLCAHVLKNNHDIYGIISDDSDMLIFGAPILMRKSINQQFTIIELSKLIEKINELLENIFKKNVQFTLDNLIDFSILLGTDYGTFKLNKDINDSLEILKYYIINDKIISNIISDDQLENFGIIKDYYKNFELESCVEHLLNKPTWIKPKTLELKFKLLELNVDEEYIDKNCQIINNYYNKLVIKSRTYYNKKYYEAYIDHQKNLSLFSEIGAKRLELKKNNSDNIDNSNNIDNSDSDDYNIYNKDFKETIFKFEK